MRKVSSLFPTPAQLICSPSRKVPKLFSAVYVSKLIFRISPLPIIIRIFSNNSILKSPIGLPLKANFRLFVRQCRHDIDRLNHSRRKRPSNLSTDELFAFKSLRSRNDVVIKPADKGGAVVVWRADLYRQEALRQLNDASFYTKLKFRSYPFPPKNC